MSDDFSRLAATFRDMETRQDWLPAMYAVHPCTDRELEVQPDAIFLFRIMKHLGCLIVVTPARCGVLAANTVLVVQLGFEREL
jgi:hypothetical protein